MTTRKLLSRTKMGIGLLLAGTCLGAENGTVAPQPTRPFPVKGFVEYIASEADNKSFPRGNFFYKLPGKVNGYTFAECYEDGSIYAKSILSRKLTNSINLSNITRSANEGLTDSGFGLEYSFKNKKGNFKASAKLTPVWLNSNGDRVRNKQVFTYFTSWDINSNWNITSYADINLDAKQGAEWVVGEIPITRKLPEINRNLSVGYIPILRREKPGSVRPTVENRVEVIWRF